MRWTMHTMRIQRQMMPMMMSGGDDADERQRSLKKILLSQSIRSWDWRGSSFLHKIFITERKKDIKHEIRLKINGIQSLFNNRFFHSKSKSFST